jgi:hypothetical protein
MYLHITKKETLLVEIVLPPPAAIAIYELKRSRSTVSFIPER